MDLGAVRRAATYLVAGALALGVGVRILAPPPRAAPIELSPAPDGAGSSSRIYVDVAGAVRRPGLYRLPAGARAGDAIERAGGRTRQAESTGPNLAARLEDGQQIVVATESDAPASPGAPGAAADPAAQPVPDAPASLDLSTATAEQIDAAAEGIGPTIAARVVEFRDQAGGLASVEQLREVPGIGEARLQALTEVFGP